MCKAKYINAFNTVKYRAGFQCDTCAGTSQRFLPQTQAAGFKPRGKSCAEFKKMGIPEEMLFVPGRGVLGGPVLLPAQWGQRRDGHCTVCRCHQGDTCKCLLIKSQKDQNREPRRTKIGGPEKTASFHRGAHLAGKSSLLIHESFDEFSVFRAIPATEQVLSGLGFCRGWQEWHGLP